MSKLWLLLLLVAAAYAYPASPYEDEDSDYMEDPGVMDTVKEKWGKFSKLTKEKAKEFVIKLQQKFCTKNDFAEDVDYEEEDGEKPTTWAEIVKQVNEIVKLAKEKTAEKKEKLKELIKKLKAKLCSYQVNDVEEEDEEELEDDMLEDSEQTTWGILKEAFGKLKGRFSKVAKEKMMKVVALLKKRYCSQQNDFEEDEQEEDEPSEGSWLAKLKSMRQKMKDMTEKLKEKYSKDKAKLKEELNKLWAKFCDRLEKLEQQEDIPEEYEEDGEDEERGFGKWIKKFAKKMKGQMKKAMKSGAKYLKKNAIKVTPLECEGETCKSCIKTLVQVSGCVEMTLLKEGQDTYLDIKITVNGDAKLTKKVKLGDVPSCVDIGGFIGKICLKGLQGKGKSSQGKANVNFCLAVLAEKHGVGCKFCASYQNKKFKVKMSPKLFAGGTSEDGDMVEIANNGEDGQSLLGPDEYELD